MNAPIRWYGGKSKLAAWILEIMKRYEHTSYIEPFGGSGAVLFAKEQSPLEVYNDIYGDVCNMYEVIRNPKTFREFKRIVALTPFSRRMFDNASYTLRTKRVSSNLSAVERAAHFFVVSRHCFGGSGGKKPGWSYSITTNRAKQASAYLRCVDRLNEVHQRLAEVQIENLDAVECINRYAFRNASGCSLIYCDPPYLFATRKETGNYKHEFTNVQHYRFIESMLRVPGHKIISGYESEFYKPLLEAGWTLETKRCSIGCAQMKNFAGKEHLKERTECLYCSPIE